MSESLELNPLFWMKVQPTGFCWEWTGALSHGYGSFKARAGSHQAHRISYTALVGEIPQGLVLDHLCSNKRCVNPDHLEVVTQAENVWRGFSMAGHAFAYKRTHCSKGHELPPFEKGKGRRGGCRVCKNASLSQRVLCPHCDKEMTRRSLSAHRKRIHASTEGASNG